jgi:hypothetical protein
VPALGTRELDPRITHRVRLHLGVVDHLSERRQCLPCRLAREAGVGELDDELGHAVGSELLGREVAEVGRTLSTFTLYVCMVPVETSSLDARQRIARARIVTRTGARVTALTSGTRSAASSFSIQVRRISASRRVLNEPP